ncbi:MAG TPA: DNA-directed RNA polymerase subunit alpha [Candidatus Nanoarchaeia archaeon]|nr:DNA-directed RNA polymerase subunit alpha [Candidatus Nanoarchaeia archaeon]
MIHHSIVLPSKPKIVNETDFAGTYEIDGFYPGYGHTLGNSLRRMILSSLPGAAITSVKIAGTSHEFSTISGVKEDVITLLLNLKRVRIKMLTDEPQTLTLKIKGAQEIKAGDIKAPGQVSILNPELVIAHTTDKNADLSMEITVEKGLGFVSKESLQKNRVDIGTITVDAVFTPIRKVSYEVENMRVGDRTDFNRLRINIETDGTISPREALEKAIEIMINQLKAIVGFKEEEIISSEVAPADAGETKELDQESLKTRIETLELSQRTINALTAANIRTLGGLVRKKKKDILEVEGLGAKGISEIKKVLEDMGVTLK